MTDDVIENRSRCTAQGARTVLTRQSYVRRPECRPSFPAPICRPARFVLSRCGFGYILCHIKSWQKLHGRFSSLFCMVEICWPVCLINGATRSCQDDLLPFASDLCIHVNVSLSTSLLNVSRQRMRKQHESARSQQQANTFLYNCCLHSSGLISLMSCLTLTPKRHTFALSKEWILQTFTLQQPSLVMEILRVKRHLQTVDLPLPSSIAGGYTSDVDCRALATISKNNSQKSCKWKFHIDCFFFMKCLSKAHAFTRKRCRLCGHGIAACW